MTKLVYLYYVLSIGIEPEDKDFNRTLATANYLKDNGYEENEIMKIFKKINKERIEGEDLPEELWENSLLEKGVFYYSDILHIKSKPPSWDPITFTETCEEFFLEMKINYTIDDLVEYYYEKCRIIPALKDEKRDKGALSHLVKKYNGFNKMPGIDYVIALINKAGNDTEKEVIADVFEIGDYIKEVMSEFDGIYEQATYEKTNKIVWREE